MNVYQNIAKLLTNNDNKLNITDFKISTVEWTDVNELYMYEFNLAMGFGILTSKDDKLLAISISSIMQLNC